MDSRFQIFGAKTTPDIRSWFLEIVIGPETILPDISGGPTDFREGWYDDWTSSFLVRSLQLIFFQPDFRGGLFVPCAGGSFGTDFL